MNQALNPDILPEGLALRHAADQMDRLAHTALSRFSNGLAPGSLSRAMHEWATCLALSPGAQARLMAKAQQEGLLWWGKEWGKLSGNWPWAAPGAEASEPAEGTEAPRRAASSSDPLYAQPEWDQWPWRWWRDANEAGENWWTEAVDLRGLSPHAREQMRFFASRWMDALSPANSLVTNPAAIERAIETRGESLRSGASHWLEGWRQRMGLPTGEGDVPALAPGQGLAMTPGEVVYRNHLVELIQYSPSTEAVHENPVFIVPSCIMKFYILDLSEHNSMVRWLVGQGHTVYIVSWRNPDASDGLLEFDEYVRQGVIEPLQHIHSETLAPVHLTGYCLGGTFAAMAAAHLQSDQEKYKDWLASVTLLAAETDFTEPGEIGVLIDEAQVTLLEDLMAEKGYLTGRQMGGAFQFLHARDLVWAQQIHSVLMGEAIHGNDLMAWNADVTRMPALMHSQYLRRLYLHNDLAAGRYSFDGRALSLRDIHSPMFVVGTEKDHVSPWTSVFKIHQLVSGDVRFVLTSGGHNAGIVSEPGHARRHFRCMTTAKNAPRPSPSALRANADLREGSWWTEWSQWLIAQGSGQQVPARVPSHDPDLGQAPGQYVMVRYND